MAVFAAACAEGLRDQSVEAEKDALAKKREDDEERGAEADGTHGHGRVGQTADHHSVHYGHAHPAEFGEDEREREAECGAHFAEVRLEAGGHGVKEV